MKENITQQVMYDLQNREDRDTFSGVIDETYARKNPQILPLDSKNVETEKYPDARLHKYYSFVKSGFRILGFALLPFHLPVAAVVLIGAEVVGILEELV